MRVWHSACSWLKLIVAAESVAGNTRTGMLTRLIFRNPFHVGRAAIAALSFSPLGAVQIIGYYGLRASAFRLRASGFGLQASGFRWRILEEGLAQETVQF